MNVTTVPLAWRMSPLKFPFYVENSGARFLDVRCVRGIVGQALGRRKKMPEKVQIIPINRAPRELTEALIDAGILVVTEDGLKCAE